VSPRKMGALVCCITRRTSGTIASISWRRALQRQLFEDIGRPFHARSDFSGQALRLPSTRPVQLMPEYAPMALMTTRPSRSSCFKHQRDDTNELFPHPCQRGDIAFSLSISAFRVHHEPWYYMLPHSSDQRFSSQSALAF
jgi:hypothetical protein